MQGMNCTGIMSLWKMNNINPADNLYNYILQLAIQLC
jgi:hypothetical protein